MSKVSKITNLPFTPDVQQQLQEHEPTIRAFQSTLASSPLRSEYPASKILSEALLDDRCAYRWLKARSFSIGNALTMLSQAMAYREQHQLDHILTQSFPEASLIRQLSFDTLHGQSREGHPIFIERFGYVNLSLLAEHATPAQRLHYYHYLHEYIHCVLLPQHSRAAGHHIDQLISIFDMSRMSTSLLGSYNYTFVKSIIPTTSLLYPESMVYTYIINTPFVFSMAWNMVKHFIDGATRDKIIISKHTPTTKLAAHIDLSQLPAFLGGTHDCLSTISTTDQDCINNSAQIQDFDAWVMGHSEGEKGLEGGLSVAGVTEGEVSVLEESGVGRTRRESSDGNGSETDSPQMLKGRYSPIETMMIPSTA